MKSSTQAWGSRLGLILATAGSAVGLGNFLRFPIQIIKNGGGTFIIPYLVSFFIMGIPLLFIEWAMGRIGSRSNKHSTPFILASLHKGKFWKYVGAIGIFSNIVILSYYCYIESWALSYAFHSVIGSFSGLSQQDIANFFSNYTNLVGIGLEINMEPIIFYVICIFFNIYILSKGIKGIEKTAKIAMPLLLFLGFILAIKGWILGKGGVSDAYPDANAWDGLNFIWNVHYDSIWDPKVWMTAAGHVFFSISVGAGSIHCYASYMKPKGDIPLNALSSSFTNVFIEVLLGGAIVIPIAAGYLGLDWIKENSGFGLAFQTMPYLFESWGRFLAPLGGLLWFGLLFFAGIISSLSMGAPLVSLLEDEFNWKKSKFAYLLGFVILFLGLPCVFFFQQGILDEYDYWAGTLSLFLLAFFEIILFIWFFGMKKGWKEITTGADIKVPKFMRYITQYITPYVLFIIFFGAIFTPLNNDWKGAFYQFISKGVWPLGDDSLIRKITQSALHTQIENEQMADVKRALEDRLFYTNFSRGLLLILFIVICFIVYIASRKKKKNYD